jgi:hypothetical protein
MLPKSPLLLLLPTAALGIGAAKTLTLGPYPPPALDVEIAAPSAGTTVRGTVSVAASVEANAGATVHFRVDGELIASDREAPFSVEWDTTAVSDGRHVLLAIADGGEGILAISTPVSIRVDNLPAGL